METMSSSFLYGVISSNDPRTWSVTGRTSTRQVLHAVGGAEVVLECAVGVHGGAEVELRSEGEQRAGVVGVFDGADTDAQQPVHVQHLLLQLVKEHHWN